MQIILLIRHIAHDILQTEVYLWMYIEFQHKLRCNGVRVLDPANQFAARARKQVKFGRAKIPYGDSVRKSHPHILTLHFLNALAIYYSALSHTHACPLYSSLFFRFASTSITAMMIPR